MADTVSVPKPNFLVVVQFCQNGQMRPLLPLKSLLSQESVSAKVGAAVSALE